MSDQESVPFRRIVSLGILGLIAMIGISIVLSLYFSTRHGAFYYPFFPFHFGWLGGILLLLIIIWVARWLFWPWRARYYPYRHQDEDAESILKVRYARGEIAKEQFEQMMRDLERRS
jgi:putative membrane protein